MMQGEYALGYRKERPPRCTLPAYEPEAVVSLEL